MNTPKKPTAKSPLQMMPEDRQAAVIELMKTSSTEAVRKHLADDGFKTSARALSEFWSWWHLRQQYQQTQTDVQQFLEMFRRDKPDLSEEKLFAYGQQMFSVLAMKQENPLDWSRIQKTSQREKILALERDKFETDVAKKLLDKALRLKADEINASDMSNADKIAAMRREAFKSVDELEKSGEVQIPK